MVSDEESHTLFKIKVAKRFYHLMAIAGLLLLVMWWSATAIFTGEVGLDVGLYAITILLMGAGLVGSLLYRELEKEALAEQGAA